MIPPFEKLHRQLGRVTFLALVASLGFCVATWLCALLGLLHAVHSLGGATMAMAYVFGILLFIFLVSSVAAALIRWLDRRHQRVDQHKAA
ncbi:MAG: hypothetical protein V4689_22470 [Verrucomicrobiota bacterium]